MNVLQCIGALSLVHSNDGAQRVKVQDPGGRNETIEADGRWRGANLLVGVLEIKSGTRKRGAEDMERDIHHRMERIVWSKAPPTDHSTRSFGSPGITVTHT